MSWASVIVFGVMLLSGPDEGVNEVLSRTVAEDADRGVRLVEGPKAEAKHARITSRSSDFDRQEGVVMFEGDVVVSYDKDYTLCADRLYLFLAASNDLRRVVAVGHVTITNETRVGKCAMATFRRARSEIEMFWDGQTKTLARLEDHGPQPSVLEGSRVKFWLDSEQVEIDNSQISVQSQGKDSKVL